MKRIKNQLNIELAAPAMIMAFGICFVDVIKFIPLTSSLEYLLIIMFTLSSLIIFTLVAIYHINMNSVKELLLHPIRIFAIGTWIAALSTFLIVLNQYEILNHSTLTKIAIINMCLLCFFILCCMYGFIQLFVHKELKVDGIVLLSTVSIQSVVIMHFFIFDSAIHSLTPLFISLGLICYVIGLTFMIIDFKRRHWTLADGWANTNCIIHGALSITGLASVLTQSFTNVFILALLCLTTVLFFIVETIECIRLFHRFKQYHLRDGVFNYHVTQWSRNFTFGMFFTFIYTVQAKGLLNFSELLSSVTSVFLHVWAIIVVIFLIIETMLFIHSKLILLSRKRKVSIH